MCVGLFRVMTEEQDIFTCSACFVSSAERLKTPAKRVVGKTTGHPLKKGGIITRLDNRQWYV